MEMKQLVEKQRQFYQSHQTKDVSYRKKTLKRLRSAIMMYEKDISAALYQDLHKAEMESYMTEVGMVLSELTYQLRHLDTWAKPKQVRTPLAQFPSKSFQLAEPYGVVLVMSPWNYGAIDWGFGSRKYRYCEAQCVCFAHLGNHRQAHRLLF